MTTAFRDEDERDRVEDSSSISSSEDEQENDDGSSSSADDDVDGASDHHDERDEMKEIRKFAQAETNRVCVWKAVLLVIILVAAELVIAGTYRFLKMQEEEDFENEFGLYATSINDRIHSSYETLQAGTSGMANSISGFAMAEKMSFPYVTINDFEARGQDMRESTGVETFFFSPYVQPDQKQEWVNYSEANAEWFIEVGMATALALSDIYNYSDRDLYIMNNYNYSSAPVAPCIYYSPEAGQFACLEEPFDPQTFHAPIWQHSPPLVTAGLINAEWFAMQENRDASVAMQTLEQSVFSAVQDLSQYGNLSIRQVSSHAFHYDVTTGQEARNFVMVVPVFAQVNNRSSGVVGQLTAFSTWDFYLEGLLPDYVRGVQLVLDNTCNQSYTYDLRDGRAYFLGVGDLHDNSYNSMRRSTPFYHFEDDEKAEQTPGHCLFTFYIYPTEQLEEDSESNMPLILSIIVGATFGLMILSFFIYDIFVTRRNDKILFRAAQATGIVSTMFPGQFRDQLLDQAKNDMRNQEDGGGRNNALVNSNDNPRDSTVMNTLADFFPDTTIMFADIVGFTAWSSTRQPTQVFELLETVYAAFDEIAKMRRVFKVETVGDCYVAVAGLPEPRKDHAVAMARFARDCVQRMRQILPQLEVKLGPDTAELSMRVGLHSGAVTAGVLRGERSRFQLFGDTMNTASRMESTGKPDMIQVSHDTAELLKAAGKSNWLSPREEMIEAKGKGMMVTYWLAVGRGIASSGSSLCSSNHSTNSAVSAKTDMLMEDLDNAAEAGLVFSIDGKKAGPRDLALEAANKTRRLVDWNVEILVKLLKKIVAQRSSSQTTSWCRVSEAKKNSVQGSSDVSSSMQDSFHSATSGALGHGNALDEVKEIISLPHYDENKKDLSLQKVDLDDEIVRELREFVCAVAALYRDNPFHSFEHASHVAMATLKLLKRVVNPKIDGVVQSDDKADFSKLHNYTYGITSDPLTQFACVFSAVIHDLDHPGVPNFQLKKENPDMALLYERSIAEQNSLDLAWNLFESPQYTALRHAVCSTSSERKRFRQLVVNLVMATDVMDKDLNGFRNARWQKAFGENTPLEEDEKTTTDRKATIVIEHLIQASDVSHTMQHWHVYRKWNARLFQEMYEAYLNERAESDPSLKWYEGEMGFFDFYVIPLAKKLADCGVFGVSSSEYLDYAMRNRREWEDRGKDIVAELLEEAKAAHARKIQVQSLLKNSEVCRSPAGSTTLTEASSRPSTLSTKRTSDKLRSSAS